MSKMNNLSEEASFILQKFNKFQKDLNKELTKSGRRMYIQNIEFNPHHACGGETEILLKVTSNE